MGNAEWTGVPLATVLELVGVKDSAVEVVLEGADHGEVTEEPKSPGDIHFERSLPIAKARRPEVLLAYQMNGDDLTPEHGFPVRAVVPGWFGMASVKWLSKLTLAVTPFCGFWQSLEYSYFERRDGRPTLVPVTEMFVKASIARPMLQEVVPAGKDYRVFGAAWAGEQEVAAVEVSTDDGSTWKRRSFWATQSHTLGSFGSIPGQRRHRANTASRAERSTEKERHNRQLATTIVATISSIT